MCKGCKTNKIKQENQESTSLRKTCQQVFVQDPGNSQEKLTKMPASYL
jgi:hypothetical protein